MKDQVRRMAENDEPKCKNCKHWQAIGVTFGVCLWYGDNGLRPETTDLSLCSQWEPKE